LKYLIVNADDFGASSGINRGILDLHRRGVVTSASLMVNMPAAGEAALLSREVPALSVGMHVNFTNEGESPVVSLADSHACREELERQFSQFEELMRCLPTHIDSHHHVHRRPNLLPLFLDLSSRYRVPLRDHSPARYFGKFYGQWDGETHLEWISPENLCRLLDTELRDGVTELSCHPGYVDGNFQSVYLTEREAELRTLCDPMLREFLVLRGIELIGFRDVAQVPLSQPTPEKT
jgi:chitin disaccharide deacetylase